MADMSAFSAAMGSLRLAGDIARGLLTIRDGQMMQAKVIELQDLILAAQQSALSAQADQFALLQDKRELEDRAMKAEAWADEANRYALHEVTPGCFVYALKPEMAGAEPSHHICANCYSDRRKSLLQMSDSVHATCPHCKSMVRAKPSGRLRPGLSRRDSGW